MGYKKCPRCGLNYIKDDQDYCDVCQKEMNYKLENKISLKRNLVIKTGDIFPFSRNYELINFLTGRNLKNYYKTTYKITDTCYLWLIALDGQIRGDWKDIFLYDGRIKENFVGDKSNPPSNIDLTFQYIYKAVFQKYNDSFIFKGIYKLDKENISLFERYYIKVSDTTTLNDF